MIQKQMKRWAHDARFQQVDEPRTHDVAIQAGRCAANHLNV